MVSGLPLHAYDSENRATIPIEKGTLSKASLKHSVSSSSTELQQITLRSPSVTVVIWNLSKEISETYRGGKPYPPARLVVGNLCFMNLIFLSLTQMALPSDFHPCTPVSTCVGGANFLATSRPQCCDSPDSCFAATHFVFEERLRDQCQQCDCRFVDRVLGRTKIDLVFIKNLLSLICVSNFWQGKVIGLQHAVFDQIEFATAKGWWIC